MENQRIREKEKRAKIKMTESLAEFIGVYLGDGTLTNNFIRISGDKRYDLPYFRYLQTLLEDFGIVGRIKLNVKTNNAEIYFCSTALCRYFSENLKIRPGDKIKNRSKIPLKILKNPILKHACLRGLVDADGSMCRRGTNGKQFCLAFTSHNFVLFNQVYKLFDDLGINVSVNSSNTEMSTNSWQNICQYVEACGSSNLRHIVRFIIRLKFGKSLYKKDVLKYYDKPLYKGLKIPFKHRTV